MALATLSTQELSDNIVAQLDASLSQTIPLLPKAFSRVLAKALAGVLVLIYKYAGFVFLQMFVAHATMAETVINGKRVRPLVEWGRLVGAGDPIAATRAEHVVSVRVQNQIGSLPAGSQLLRAETGVLYLTVAAVALNAPTVEVGIRASSVQEGRGGEGSIGNLPVGAIVSFANPLPNVGADATVLSQTVTAADAETPDAYRARIVRRFQRKPQGGAYADYQQWGEEAPGIRNVYPYTGAPGEVDVYVESTGLPDGIPTPSQLQAVKALIELDDRGLASRRSVNAWVNTYPITRKSFDVVVAGLDVPDRVAALAAIQQAVDEYMRSREPFIVGLSILPRTDRITAGAIGGIVDDAVSAVGGTVTTATLKDGPDTIFAYTLGQGEKAKAGAVVPGER